MFYKALNKKSKIGFTLIELLVVISIIGLLSTLAAVALKNARLKARNTKRLADITQYHKAFELAFDANNEYPDTGNTTSWYCLGDYSDNRCWSSSGVSESATLNAILDDFIPALPVTEGLVCSWEGTIYRCLDRPSGYCTGVELVWFMEGTYQSCGAGRVVSNDYYGCTYCLWDIIAN